MSTDRLYDALLEIEELLGPLGGGRSEEARRIYLAYITAIDAREPMPSRTQEIAELRERLGLRRAERVS